MKPDKIERFKKVHKAFLDGKKRPFSILDVEAIMKVMEGGGLDSACNELGLRAASGVRESCLDHAQRIASVLKNVTHPTTGLYNNALHYNARIGDIPGAYDVLALMGENRVLLNSRTHVELITLYRRHQCKKEALFSLNYLFSHGFPWSITMGVQTFVTMKSVSYSEAFSVVSKVVDQSLSPSHSTWISLCNIAAREYPKGDRLDTVFALMHRAGAIPNKQHYSILLKSISREVGRDKAKEIAEGKGRWDPEYIKALELI
eukprot:TRINITY_DN3887_c1_g3_i1.p1 TRINITY_DN3887_c1_g3~~TRINITY_DN3887_c1_g3_i1.p1  ORF type:complete len:260 (+),score=36.92 TRINITY_DN3887_c1_g3_i1:57-836(+)